MEYEECECKWNKASKMAHLLTLRTKGSVLIERINDIPCESANLNFGVKIFELEGG
ncbi:MAG: hypothetical protein LBR09_02170 [Endomicrobium sp.]|jgi:hypothetical protein|nr:hypothetical protein [Endomicrobium sp.]